LKTWIAEELAMLPITLPIEPLTAAAFAPFGDVIEASDRARRMTINEGFTERYHDLARVDLGNGAAAHHGETPARTLISIFRSKPRQLPLRLSLMERHPLGSQAFMPLSRCTFLVVVAPGGAAPDLTGMRCFLAAAGQGVNYACGTWHHPLLSLKEVCDFLVIDRGGPGVNLEEYPLPQRAVWIPSQAAPY
jgi:ureidoglycolate lyase